MDEDLKLVIKSWNAPAASEDADRRMMASFRRRMPFWRRCWTARVAVPVPVIAAGFIVMSILCVWIFRLGNNRSGLPSGWRPVAEPILRVIKQEGAK
jgi:hypothetical protein